MLKSIFAVLLSLSCLTAAYAAVSPISLLHNQCIEFNNDAYLADLNQSTSIELSQQATTLEYHLLSIVNLRDSVHYYRQYSLAPQENEYLLQCQLHLADLFEELIHQPKVVSIVNGLSQAADPQLRLLGEQLTQLQSQTLAITPKAKLHTAQATIKRGLAPEDVSLLFSESQCEINSTDANSNRSINLTVAGYLMRQTDTDCRRKVWQAYQARASQRNSQALQQIWDIRQQQANNQGFADYTAYSLTTDMLQKPARVKLFLDGQTKPTVSPWDLPQMLKQATSTNTTSISGLEMLLQAYQVLAEFGVRVEQIDQRYHRIWLDNRLLGDVIISSGNRSKLLTRRHGVLGHQFAQIELKLPDTLNNYRQQQQLVNTVAQAFEQLSYSQRHYLLNSGSANNVSRQIGQLWLSQYLQAQLLPAIADNSREKLLAEFRHQQRVFRAKIAVSFYALDAPYTDLPQQFTNSFGQPWLDEASYPLHFYAIAEQGPLYYQHVWQSALSQYIYRINKPCQNQHHVFTTLLVNEPALPLASILTTLLGEALTPTQLIERINHAQAAENKHLSTCAS
ncbi:M3 family metallopeptidase [Shewanella waksmanii]|uniref:M3 family metallopeptidase n=1 Tax=Shewanella waksmanii TaxID=213783 RepID=UPI0004919C51|nr:M3 family metallopeptidase [Shewanella waksmanii]